MFEISKQKKILFIGAIGLIVLLGAIGYFYFFSTQTEEYIPMEEFQNEIQNVEKNEIIEEVKKIVVHISGQVVNPGVFSLEDGSRLIDAINRAGGTTKEADLSKVNLAYLIEDAQKIYIPSIKEKEEVAYISKENGDTTIVTNGNTTKTEEKIIINLNTANEEELEKIPGIGASIANKIIAYRKENGKFKAIEDIKNVSGIGESKFSKIKEYICIK